jgi:EAL domain-containing protein (putative c-di-GMP-specific phosphodiesterase class I)
VNFSPIQFRRSHFVGHVMESVRRAGVKPERVQIEITETAIFDDAEHAAQTLCELRALGFRIALDDFGTGYSSLYNIRKFALDCLKIDRSFIDGMGRERESAAIVHSIIHLGRALGLGVIAEGVETESQAQALRVAGASHLQGFLFSKPVPATEARKLAEIKFMTLQGEVEATAPMMAGARR